MQLKDLIKKFAVLRVEGSLDREVAGIVYDSRRVTPGMVFVAIPGAHVDGHDYINSAIDRADGPVVALRIAVVESGLGPRWRNRQTR